MNNMFWQEMGFNYVGPRVENNSDDESYLYRNLLSLLNDSCNEELFNAEELDKRSKIKLELELGINNYNKNKADRNIACLDERTLTRREKFLLKELPIVYEYGEYKLVVPLTVEKTIKMAIINPWPGEMHAEAEVVKRMRVAAKNLDMQLDTVDRFGRILESDELNNIGKIINGEDYLFIINTHFDTHKAADVFYYHTLWNPPELPLSWDRYDVMSDNYLMNDDFLIYGEGTMLDHLKMILFNSPRNLENASMLTASFPENKMLAPKLNAPKMFYCGMNWDVFMNGKGRHDGIFKLLDETGKIKFYGPDVNESWGGIRPWKGYKCYQFPIPFDGFSILEKINECGVCLVLSSDSHRRAGAASSRVYEACAAGAVIISDNNEFVSKHFADAALFIDYNPVNPKDTFNQIMEKYNWILENPEQAKELVVKAQNIFKEKFALEKQISDIVRNHTGRIHKVEEKLFAVDSSKKVLATYVLNTMEDEYIEDMLSPVLENVKNQLYGNITLAIACDERVSSAVEKYLNQNRIDIKLESLNLYDNHSVRTMTDGEAIRILQEKYSHDLWINMYSHDVWFCDHISTMVKEFSSPNVCAAYSGRLGFDKGKNGRVQLFDSLKRSIITKTAAPQWLPGPSQIMFSAKCEELVENYMMKMMDGMEQYLYLAVCWQHFGYDIKFTKRMTFGWRHTRRDVRCDVVDEKYQLKLIRDIVKYDKKGRIEDIGIKK